MPSKISKKRSISPHVFGYNYFCCFWKRISLLKIARYRLKMVRRSLGLFWTKYLIWLEKNVEITSLGIKTWNIHVLCHKHTQTASLSLKFIYTWTVFTQFAQNSYYGQSSIILCKFSRKNKRPIGLNGHLSIRDSTLTSCQKGSYFHNMLIKKYTLEHYWYQP